MSALPWHREALEKLAGRRDRLPHALLVTGRTGIGKADFAREFAKSLLCESPREALACGACPSCGWFDQGNHPDFREVLPEAAEVDIDIPASDIRIDTMRSSGAGGQHVNTTDSAVRITHLPSGIVVTSSEKSQHQNRAIAMQVLRARLYDMERQKADAERAAARKSQVGSGDRSERIRTYNFPQGRMTDHRIGLTLYRLTEILAGDLDEVIDALVAEDQAAKLAEAGV